MYATDALPASSFQRPLIERLLKIGTAATLEVIPVETPYGWVVLGAVVQEAMQPAAVAVVIDALTHVAAPPAAASLAQKG